VTAVVSGSAANPSAYYAALLAALTANAALVAANQEWVNVWEHEDGPEEGVVLRGPGLSDQNQIYVGLRLVQNPVGDSYCVEAIGMTGALPDASSWLDHVNVTPHSVRIFLNNLEFDYWFVMSGRRFICVNKISTVYQALYAGFFLPFATPDAYPYPYFLGGSAGADEGGANAPASWRDVSAWHSHFVQPSWDVLGNTDRALPQAWMMTPGGVWEPISHTGTKTTDLVIHPNVDDRQDWFDGTGITFYSLSTLRAPLIECFGGELWTMPFTIMDTAQSQTYGSLDGVEKCQGYGNAAENEITVDGDTYLVVQNSFRTTPDSYWALKLD
jgi:hypothetical protein